MAGSPGDLTAGAGTTGAVRCSLRWQRAGGRYPPTDLHRDRAPYFSGLAAGAETGSPEVSTRIIGDQVQASGGSPGDRKPKGKLRSSVGLLSMSIVSPPSERTQPHGR